MYQQGGCPAHNLNPNLNLNLNLGIYSKVKAGMHECAVTL